MEATSAATARNEDKSQSFEGDFLSVEVLEGVALLVSVLSSLSADCFEQLTASNKIADTVEATVRCKTHFNIFFKSLLHNSGSIMNLVCRRQFFLI